MPFPSLLARVACSVALLVLLAMAAPSAVLAHDDAGPVAGDDTSAAEWRDIALQADFAGQLQEAPLELLGTCVRTATFDGVGEGCRTRGGLLRLQGADGTTTLTHGPDFLEGSTDVDPATMPPRMVAAVQGASRANVDCVPGGGRRTQVYYAMAVDGVDRSATQVPLLRQSVYELSAVIDNESRSLAPTMRKRLRVACDSSGNLDVQVVRLPTRGASATFTTMSRDLRAITGEVSQQGVSRTLVYYDGDLGSFSGIADIANPTGAGALSSANANNGGALIAMQDNSTGSEAPDWQVLLHEVTHNMGAVVKTAPDANNVGHCNDGLDVMCYAEPGTPGVSGPYVTTACAQLQYDCDHDTYFNPAPAGGDWLATNWNVAGSYNGFLTHDTVAGDTAAPTAPMSLAAAGHGSFIHLTWGASTDVGGSGVHAYRAYRRNGATWVPAGDSWPGDLTLDVSSGISASTSYDLQVRAYDARGNESLASSVTVNSGATDATNSVSGAPALAVPTNVVVSTSTSNSITLAWDAPVGSGITTTVSLFGATTPAFWPMYFTSGSSASVTTDAYGDPLAAGTRYRFQVQSTDALGRRSPAVEVAGWTRTAADATAPAMPSGLAIASVGGNTPTLDWSDTTDAVSYVVARRVGVAAWTELDTVTQSAAAVAGLGFATTYELGVAARDEAGNTSAYATVTHTTGASPDITVPTAPGVMILTPGLTTIGAGWDPSTDNVGVAGYRLLVAPATSGQYTLAATTTGGSAVATSLVPGTAYRVMVVAFDAAGNSSWTGSYYGISTTADTVAPSAPTGLAVTGSTTTSIDLAWSPSNDNVTVTEYRVYANGVLAGSTTGSSLSVTGLAHTTSYSFTVRAVDSSGNGTTSTAFVASTRDGSAPTQPGPLSVSAAAPTALSLTWGASNDNVGVTSYRVYRQSPNPSGAVIASPTTTSFTATGLEPATAYTFRVTAVDAANNESTYAEFAASTPAAVDSIPPTAPGAFGAASVTTSSATLTWTAATDNVAVTGYRIYRVLPTASGAPVATVPSTDLTLTLTGLASTSPYRFAIAAVDGAGLESPRAEVEATTLDGVAPTVPTSLAASAVTGSSLTLGWTASTDDTGVVGYRVWRTAPGPATLLGTTTATNFAVAGLAEAASYSFEVIALDARANASPPAAITRSTLDVTAPAAPPSVSTASVTVTGLDITWGSAIDNVAVTGYRVYRDGPGGRLLASLAATARGYSVSGLTSTTGYTLSVTAVDAAANESPHAAVSTSTLDGVAPSAPTGLAATGISGSGLSLSWTTATDDTAVVQYRVVRTGPGGAVVTTTPAPVLVVTGLLDATSYTFSITALDARANESLPGSITRTTLDVTPPTFPSTVSFTPTGLAWSAGADNDAVVAYRVTRTAPAPVTTIATTAARSVVVDHAAPSTTYAFSVVAIDAAGNESAPVVATTTTPAAPVVDPPIVVPPVVTPDPPVPAPPAPTAPGAPVGLAATVTSSRATITWGAAAGGAVTGYRVSVTRAGVALPTIEQAATSLQLGPFAPRTVLIIALVATGPGGASAPQALTVATLADRTAPGVPGRLRSVSSKRGAIALSWTAARDDVAVAAYEVRWSRPGTKPAVRRATSLATTLAKLMSGRTYTVQVRALDAAGNASAWSTARTKVK